MRLALLISLMLLGSYVPLFGQFTPLGSASQTSTDCYTLTPNLGGQTGAIWNTTQLNLNNPFDIYAEVFLGCSNGGADGMTFAMQGVGLTALGTAGGSMGYAGITPSVAVEFDTWQNATDIAQDHTALISSGVVLHNPPTSLVGPIALLPSGANVEDCQPHDVRITWDPLTDSLKVYFDCFLRIAYQGDIVANQFGGNSLVWWGFTAGTGGATNLQTVCLNQAILNGSLEQVSLCQGDSVELMGGPGVSYVWSPAATLSNPLIGNPLAFPTMNTTYLVTITDECGFTRVDTFAVSIDSSVVSVDLGADFAICPGQSELLDPMLPNTLNYEWQNGSTNPTFTANTPGLFWVEVSSLCSSDRDSVVVSLTAPPFADVILDPSICLGSTATATFLGVTDPGAVFIWDFGSATVLSGTGAGPYQLQWPTAGTFTVSLIIDEDGCLSNQASETITVNPTPSPTFSLSPSLCANEQAQLTYTGSASPSATFTWDLDGGLPAVNGPGPYQISWTSPGPKTVTLTVEEFGCISPPFSQTTIVNPIPEATFAMPASVCEDDSIQIVYQGPSAATASYAWTFGSGNNVLSGTGQGPYTVQWVTPGTKTVCLQVQENGCTSNLNCQTIDVTPRPNVDINPEANQCLDGNSFTFTTGSGTADAYFWNFGPSASPPTANTAVPPAVTYLSPGPKTVSLVTSLNGCLGDSSVITFDVIEEPSADFTVSSASICTDSCITYAYAGTINGPTQAFFWDFGPGAIPQTSSLANPACVEYTSGGVKTVTLTVIYRGCTSSTSKNVNVNAGPLVTAGTDREYCDGTGGVEVDGTVSGGTQPYFYTWWCDNPPNCGISNPNSEDPLMNPTISTATETHEFYFQVVDVNGCHSNIDTMVVTTKAVPIMDAGPDVFLCPKDAPGEFLQGSIAANNTAPQPIFYFWTPSVGLNNANNNPNPYARPDTTTIYTLIGVSANGCSSAVNTLDTLSTVEVVVKPKPIASAGADTSMCFGDSVQLQGFANGAGPNYAYVWTPSLPGTIDDANSPTPTVKPNATTIFTLTVISNGCESDGDQIEVFVETEPTVSAGTDETICFGDSVALDGRAGGDPNGTQYTYEWSPTTGLDNPSSAIAMASPGVTTDYVLTVGSQYGCKSVNDTIKVSLEATPEVTLHNKDTTICAGETITLRASHVFGGVSGGPVIYQWSPAQFVLSDPNDSIVIVAPTQTTRFVVKTSIANNDCPRTDEILITVNPAVSAKIEADTSRICEGDGLELRALGGRGSATYTWLPAIGLDDPTAQAPIATPKQSTTYQVVISEGDCSDTAEYEVVVNQAPQTAYLATLAEGCAPLTVAFEPQSPDATAYRWDFGDGSAISNVEAPAHIFEQPGEYLVQLKTTGTGGCEASSEELLVRVNEPPLADFVSDPPVGMDIPLPDAVVRFSDQSLTESANWFWDFGDGSFANTSEAVHSYAQQGEYEVQLTITDEQGCVSEVRYGPYSVILPDLLVPNVFSPNNDGINDMFLVQYNGTEPFFLQLQDRWGRKVFESNATASGWNGQLNGSPLPEGTYYYSFSIGELTYNGHVTLLR